jgi:mRNA-degrading endonuclease YafQ of YafQ-DinJ toxin-antitoxin module
MPQKYSYIVSRRFIKNWSKLDLRTKKETVEKIDIFLENPYSPTIKTHKLTGKLKDCWSFSVSYHLRIMFKFGQGKTVEFIDIGSHEIYK